MGQGNVFTCICHSVPKNDASWMKPRWMHPPLKVCTPAGSMHPRWKYALPRSMHPTVTSMHPPQQVCTFRMHTPRCPHWMHPPGCTHKKTDDQQAGGLQPSWMHPCWCRELWCWRWSLYIQFREQDDLLLLQGSVQCVIAYLPPANEVVGR